MKEKNRLTDCRRSDHVRIATCDAEGFVCETPVTSEAMTESEGAAS
jgi:hypothetical protein